MNKVSKWKRKMNNYYAEDLQPQKLISDLEASGFKISGSKEEGTESSNCLAAYREVAVSLAPNDTLISEDGSVAVILK